MCVVIDEQGIVLSLFGMCVLSYAMLRRLQAAFALVLGPFCFTNAQKTTPLQIITSLLRWMSFMMMIVIAIMGIHSGEVSDRP
jgi:hypothetical protein